MRIFSEQRELIQWANREVKDRVKTLEKDVNHCLLQPSQNTPNAPAPFPALLYCFATIDLLGALHSGNAKGGNTVIQAKEYMQKFMNYTIEQSDLLIELFRHKLVHLAQPKPVIKYGDQNISWHEWHKNSTKHLVKDKLKDKTKIVVTSGLSLEAEHEFNVSIMDLVKDIKNSAVGPNGYLATLERTPDLQDRFERAISQIYDHGK